MADEEEGSIALIPELYKPAGLLPIAQLKDALLYTIETYPVTIVVGETGSGKTTQIPQFLHKAGWNSDGSVMAVTQVSFIPTVLMKPFVLLLKSLVELPLPASLPELRKR
jgi:hypothetical protein